MRFIVRPNHILTTPRKLKSALGARRTIPVSSVVSADYQQDIFLAYPAPALVANAPAEYDDLFSFYHSNKYGQRRKLAKAGLPIVPTVGITPEVSGPYVIRPLRHMGGEHFRVVDNLDSLSDREYVSKLILKEKEYRILYYKGRLVVTYYKMVPEGVAADVPWNHTNGSRFATVTRDINNKLLGTDIYDRLANYPLIKTASLVGVDVLWDGKQPYITELNFSPGLSIPGTIQAIVKIEGEL